jgi:hypothetical protein
MQTSTTSKEQVLPGSKISSLQDLKVRSQSDLSSKIIDNGINKTFIDESPLNQQALHKIRARGLAAAILLFSALAAIIYFV